MNTPRTLCVCSEGQILMISTVNPITIISSQILPNICLQEITFLLASETVQIRSVARVIGHMVSSFPAVEYGPLYYRKIDKDKNDALSLHKGNFEASMNISSEDKDELNWWLTNLPASCESILPTPVDSTLYSDASKIGWGTALGKQQSTGGNWCTEESKYHINVHEMKAALCMSHKIKLTAAHFPGSKNIVADRESRHIYREGEWMLDPLHIKTAINKFKFQAEDNLFASRPNKQFTKYCSYKPDPEVTYIDAFSFPWNNLKFYCFPPFSCILQTIQKIKQEKAIGMLVIPN